MNKIEALKQIKRFLRKVVKQRSFLLNNGCSNMPLEFTRTELNNIEYAIPNLVDYDRAKAYIQRKEAEIRYLIPGNFVRWCDELDQLLQLD